MELKISNGKNHFKDCKCNFCNYASKIRNSKISIGLKRNPNISIRMKENNPMKNLKTIQKMVETRRKRNNYKQTEESRELIRQDALKNPRRYWKDKKLPEYMKEKQRVAAMKRIKENGGYPNIGRQEKQILDELELSLNCKIIRQYEVRGFFVDGYIPKVNIVFEIDERRKNNQKQIEREKIIKQELNCVFLRVPTY